MKLKVPAFEQRMKIDATSTSASVEAPSSSSNSSKDSIQIQAENRQIVQAARAVNAAGALGPNEITFSLDKNSRRMIVKIVDRVTNEVVGQIPAASILRLAEDLNLPE